LNRIIHGYLMQSFARFTALIPHRYFQNIFQVKTYHTDQTLARKDFSKLLGRLIVSEGQTIFPLPHPSSLLYRPAFECQATKNYKKLFYLLHECKWFSCCPLRRFHEAGLLERTWIELYCKGLWHTCTRYQREENGEHNPDWMLPDGSLDERLMNVSNINDS